MKPILHTFGLLNAIAVVGTLGIAPYYLSAHINHYLGWIGTLIYWSLAAYGLVSWYFHQEAYSRKRALEDALYWREVYHITKGIDEERK